MQAFLDRHKGTKAFLWTPPLGELGLYKCAGYQPINRGGRIYALAATFTQTFHP
ncbi:Phage minor tail protein [compost metagenome]